MTPAGDFISKLLAQFEALVSGILGRITGRAGDRVAKAGRKAVGAGMVRSLWTQDLDGQVLPALTEVWTAAAGTTAAGLSDLEQAVAALTAPDPADYLKAARNRLVGIGDIVWDDIRGELAAGVEQGEGIPELAARVRAVAGLAGPRSLVIARTEVVAVHNAASLAQARMIDDPTMIKEWLCTHDSKTRSTHLEADGQRVKVGELFTVGDAKLDYPADPDGDAPEETINCRCSLVVDLDDAPLAASAYDETHGTKRDKDGKFAHEAGGDSDAASVLAAVGHACFVEAEPAGTADQVVDVMRRHKAANPDMSTDDLIGAMDQAIAAKYPIASYPAVDGFYAKLLADRKADVDLPAKTTKAKAAPTKAPKAKAVSRPAPPDADFPTLTAARAQAMQDGMPPPWTGAERRGLRYYTGNSAVSNGLLRGWIDPPGKTATDQKKIESAQRNIEHIKAGMRPASQPVLVYRTAGPEQFGAASIKDLAGIEGTVLTERGFMSTSTTSKGAGVGGKVRMEIEIPEGTPMAFVKSVSVYPFEDEILLAPGLKYQVVSVTPGRGRATVRLRVVAA